MRNHLPYRTLKEFYPHYLNKHSHLISRRMHFIGTTFGLALLITAFVSQTWWLIAVAMIQGYTLAWVGHFFFEHNKPATFENPRLSFFADLRMWWEILTGKIRL